MSMVSAAVLCPSLFCAVLMSVPLLMRSVAWVLSGVLLLLGVSAPGPRALTPQRGPFHQCLDGCRTSLAREESVASSTRGKGECEARRAAGGFRDCFPLSVLRSGKESAKASRPLPGKRVLRQVAVARIDSLGSTVAPGPRPGRVRQGPTLGCESAVVRAPSREAGHGFLHVQGGAEHAERVCEDVFKTVEALAKSY